MILVDTREPETIEPHLICAGARFQRGTIASGDYVVTCFEGNRGFAVERKAMGDLLGALGTPNAAGIKRLYDQMERMRLEWGTHRLLVIEGSFTIHDGKVRVGRHQTGWTHTAMQTMLWTIQAHYGMPMLWTPDMAGTADLLRNLDNRASKGCVLPRTSGTIPEQHVAVG